MDSTYVCCPGGTRECGWDFDREWSWYRHWQQCESVLGHIRPSLVSPFSTSVVWFHCTDGCHIPQIFCCSGCTVQTSTSCRHYGCWGVWTIPYYVYCMLLWTHYDVLTKNIRDFLPWPMPAGMKISKVCLSTRSKSAWEGLKCHIF